MISNLSAFFVENSNLRILFCKNVLLNKVNTTLFNILKYVFSIKFSFQSKTLVFFIFFNCFHLVVSQISNDHQFWSYEFDNKYDSKKEIVNRRTLHEKHFKREDGKVDMLVSSEPVNYLENNQWETIFTSIEYGPTSVYKYSNTKNIFKSYYSENILNGFKTVFENEDIFEMRNLTVFYERNGEKIGVKSIQSSVGEANENKVKYSNVYGNQIDLIITQKGGKRKVDYILKSKDFIETEYFDAEYLVFSEDIFLPKGWSAKLENGSVVLINSIGQVSFSYENPSIFDSRTDEKDIQNHKSDTSLLSLSSFTKIRTSTHEVKNRIDSNDIFYELITNGRTITILTKVKMEYLLDSSRIYPIEIDPTLTASIATITTGNYFSWQPPYGPNPITTSGAPAGSYITNVELILNVTRTQYDDWFWGWTTYTGNCGSWHNFSLHDEVYPNYNSYVFSCGGNTSYFNCKDPNRSWRTEIWSWDGDYYRARWGFTVNVTYNTATTVSAPSSTPTVCVGVAISPSITITTTGATGIGSATGLPTGVFANWSSNTITISGTPTQTGTFNYSIPVTNACGSTLNATGSFTVNNTITPTFNALGPFCVGDTPPSLSGASTNGIAGTWLPTAISTVSSGISNYVFIPNSTAACETTAHTNVVVNPTPTVSLNCPALCTGIATDIIATPSPAGTYTYNWTALPGGVSDPGNSATVNTSTAGMYTVIATNTTTNCPSVATSCTIAVQNPPSINAISPP